MKEVIVGEGINVKPVIDAVPPGVITLTLPDAPAPITAVILVTELTVNDVAAIPPKLTEVAPVKFVPIMVMVAPIAALVGVKDVILGNEINSKPAREATPIGVITTTLPDDPAPTTAVMIVSDTTVNEAAA